MKGIRNYILVSCGMIGCLLICGAIAYFLFPDVFDFGGILPETGSTDESQDSDSFNLWNQVDEAQEVTIKAELNEIKIALEHYYVENGIYPENISTLVNEGYLPSLDINIVNVEYERIGFDDYTLSATLPSGEKYTLTPY